VLWFFFSCFVCAALQLVRTFFVIMMLVLCLLSSILVYTEKAKFKAFHVDLFDLIWWHPCVVDITLFIWFLLLLPFHLLAASVFESLCRFLFAWGKFRKQHSSHARFRKQHWNNGYSQNSTGFAKGIYKMTLCLTLVPSSHTIIPNCWWCFYSIIFPNWWCNPFFLR
jgi:hypothetical protein